MYYYVIYIEEKNLVLEIKSDQDTLSKALEAIGMFYDDTHILYKGEKLSYRSV